MDNRSFSNNKSPKNRVRGSSQIGGGLSHLREVDDELDDDGGRFDNDQADMINDLHSRQINVKNFDLQPMGQGQFPVAAKSMQ